MIQEKKRMENHRTVSLVLTTAPPSVCELRTALRRSAHLKNFLAFFNGLYIMGTLPYTGMRTPSHWCADISTITFYYQKYSSLQHFDKFHTCKNTCYLGVIEEILIKSTSRRWIRKLVILLKGNNIQSFPFLIFSQGWQLAGMSTGCAMKSFYTWVF